MLRKGLAGGFPIAPGWVISLVIPMDEGDRDLAIADKVTRRPTRRDGRRRLIQCVVRHLANQGHGASEPPSHEGGCRLLMSQSSHFTQFSLAGFLSRAGLRPLTCSTFALQTSMPGGGEDLTNECRVGGPPDG